jgi:phosphatidylserine/phosphatidylglycerophosphate/cardiolipin synthase-like enzyme
VSKKTTKKGAQSSGSPIGKLAAIVVFILLLLGLEALDRRFGLGIFSEPTATAPTPAVPVDVVNSADWYELYFTTPRYPDKKDNRPGSVDLKLVALINSARQSVDMAIYDFDLINVAEALASAQKRGVKVRMVTDTDTVTDDNPSIIAAFDILINAGIPVVDDQRSAIMHHKFVVVDGVKVLTGSWNFTDGDTYRLNNHAIIINSPTLAKNYTYEFEQMFVNNKFGAQKASGSQRAQLSINNVPIESYFAPKDKVIDAVINRINGAQKSIHFMAFSYTHDEMGDAMIARFKAGVDVQGVFEKTGSETEYSEFGRMKKAGVSVLQDGNPYTMHHKVIIIDGKTVILGSFNFSDNAAKSNDENLLIIDDAKLAQAFEEEYQRVRNTALNPPK